MESSRRDLFIDMVVDSFISNNNQITPPPFTPLCTKQVWDYLKQGLLFTVHEETSSYTPDKHTRSMQPKRTAYPPAVSRRRRTGLSGRHPCGDSHAQAYTHHDQRIRAYSCTSLKGAPCPYRHVVVLCPSRHVTWDLCGGGSHVVGHRRSRRPPRKIGQGVVTTFRPVPCHETLPKGFS